MKSKSKTILLIIFGILVLALIVIVILYYLGYLSILGQIPMGSQNQSPKYPNCPTTCSWKDNRLTVKVWNIRAKRWEPNVKVTFKTDDCNGGAETTTPSHTDYCTTSDGSGNPAFLGKCSIRPCIGERAAEYKISGRQDRARKCYFKTETKYVTPWSGVPQEEIQLNGQVYCE